MAGPGIGKSTLIEAITERLSAEMIVVQIHGSSALSRVPFGILAPYTAELTAEDSVSPVAVLRSVWSYFEKLKAGKDTPLLLMMDDAHHLDEATAGIVADMISAGWASVVAAGRPRPGLPQALAQLWYDGLADRVDLRPLNREQIEEVLAHALDGTVPAGTVDTIWNASGWPLAAMMFTPRFCAALISVICLMFVVPAVETIVLPFRSCSDLTFEDFFAIQRLAVTKWVCVNHTCSCRATLLVVEPHSRSIVPFAISGMRFAEVTSW